ncbi:MAG: ChbG/HpnK family deacetylase [Hyphomicrobiaceae bacterium]
MPSPQSRGVVLCADDYGLSEGVSRGIRELIAAGLLTATSAMVTFSRWQHDAESLRPLRSRASLGLHINLTAGAPLGPMPLMAPAGTLPDVGSLTRLALTRRIERQEIRAEVARQLHAFTQAIGHPPDHIDGHQHVHALPVIRDAVLDAIDADRSCAGALIRDPADQITRIVRRGHQVAKALALRVLATSFANMVHKRGYMTNSGFSGYSAFVVGSDYANELASALRETGPCHIVMCHPGYGDDELLGRDPVIARREEELAALLSWPNLNTAIQTISRPPDGLPIDWPRLCPSTKTREAAS